MLLAIVAGTFATSEASAGGRPSGAGAQVESGIPPGIFPPDVEDDHIVTVEEYDALLCALKVEYAEIACTYRYCEELEDGTMLYRSDDVGELGTFWYYEDGKIAEESVWPAKDCKAAWDAR